MFPVDFQVTWSKVKGQTTDLLLKYLLTLNFMITKLASHVDYREKIIPIAFYGSWGQGQTTGLHIR